MSQKQDNQTTEDQPPLPLPEIADGMRPGTVRQAGVILVIGFLMLALFNAQGFKKWAQKLPDRPLVTQVIDLAYFWDDQMTALGTSHVFDHIRRAFRDFRDGR